MNDSNLQKVIELRHTLHRYPELSMQEVETMARLKDFLQENTSIQVVERDGWFYGVKPGYDRQAPAIAFRADVDALPISEPADFPHSSVHNGISHKCGHDGHCAALCSLALSLEGVSLPHSVYLIFQPGEETGAGAKLCVDLIRDESIAEIYAFHNLSGYPAGTLVYRQGLTQPASEGLSICLQGKQSHASAPEEGRNPAAALAQIAVYSQQLLEKSYCGMVLCTITGLNAGAGDFGISPGEGTIDLTLRAEQEEELKQLERKLLQFSSQQAATTGLTMTYHISDAFPETRNHDSCLQRVLCCAQREGIPTLEMDRLWRASEDFGLYLKHCPGAMFYLGNGMDHPPLHSVEYDFNDSILPIAVRIMTALAMDKRDGGRRK